MPESGYYPPGAESDPRAPWRDSAAEDDAREDAWRRMTAIIGQLDGRKLYEATGTDVDAMMDVYDLPVFEKYDHKRDWERLAPMEQAMWNALAEVHAYFGHQLISEELVEGARQEGDL